MSTQPCGCDPTARPVHYCAEHTRESGVRAIIALQATVGIAETRAQAERGWDAMSARQQEATMDAYAAVIGGRP